MLKKVVPPILASCILSVLTSVLLIKFQPRIQSLTEKQTLWVSLGLLALAAIVLAIPSIVIRLNRSPQSKANLIAWGFLFYVYLSLILFATLSITALLFLASTKLPTRENLPYYLVNVGPCLGLVGVISHILLKAGQYVAYAAETRFFDISLAADIMNFIFIAWMIYAFPDKPINPITTFLSIGFGAASFSFALGTFTGTFRGYDHFIKDIAAEMRKKDQKLKLYERTGPPRHKRKKR